MVGAFNQRRSMGAVLFAAIVTVSPSCGRGGFEPKGEAAPLGDLDADSTPLNLSLDEQEVKNAENSARFSGDCSLGLQVFVNEGDGVSCKTGRFIYETPVASSDGVRVYTFRQLGSRGEQVTVVGRWKRNAESPSLVLDRERIESALDQATFRGQCTGSADSNFASARSSRSFCPALPAETFFSRRATAWAWLPAFIATSGSSVCSPGVCVSS